MNKLEVSLAIICHQAIESKARGHFSFFQLSGFPDKISTFYASFNQLQGIDIWSGWFVKIWNSGDKYNMNRHDK